MSDIIDASDELFVSFNLEFKAVRVIGARLIPTTWKLRTEVLYDEEHEDDDSYLLNTKVALAKIKFWFDNFIDGSVLMGRDNEWAQRAFLSEEGQKSVENHIALLPDEPTDQLLAEVFQSKMNALAGNFLTFGLVELNSDDLSGLTFIFTGVGEFNLPEVEEWVGERSYFSKPWWSRDDASTIDVIPDDDADLNRLPTFAYSLDFIADAVRPSKDMSAQIIRPEFRPSVIQGGKKDD
jgi:hypothetical protein